MRILLAYPGHSYSTIDVAIGYDRALRELGHTVKAFDYHNQIAFFDKALEYWSQANPTWDRRDSDAVILASERIAIAAVEFVPDVVVVVCGLSLHPRGYDLLHRLALPVVTILTESPYLDEMQTDMINFSNVVAVFTNEIESVDRLADYMSARVTYLPHSFDPVRHRPMAVPERYHTDLFFYGTLWPERKTLLRPIRDKDKDNKYILSGTKSGETDPNGVLVNDELARYYAGTKIALNHHRTISSHDNGREIHIDQGAAWSLGPRAYEIAGCGAFQLCDDTRGELTAVFGDTVATYTDADDLLSKVDYYLTHRREREDMAMTAHERVADCTFAHRAREIVIPVLSELIGE